MTRKVLHIALKAVIVLMAIGVSSLLAIFPSREGRAANLDLLSIYLDPFILYIYTASIAFFVGLYQSFRLVTFSGNNTFISQPAIKSLTIIKNCAIILSIMFAAAIGFIGMTNNGQDDMAGGVAMGLFITTASIITAMIATHLRLRIERIIKVK